ncbi:MAG: SelD-related putative sulfur metabolism protein [Candidatus Hydrothermarchaeales archaeon]
MVDFSERVKYYRSLGIDPMKWVAGCAVKVDLISVVYPSLEVIKRELDNITINPREDADIFPSGEGGVEVVRRVYDLNDPKVEIDDIRRISPDRALFLIQVYQKDANTPEKFGRVLSSIFRKMEKANVNFRIGKGHSIRTPYLEAQFALFDFIKMKDGKASGYTLANNDTIHIIDPTGEPGNEVQTFVAVSNSLNDLICLGCYENIEVYPLYDAPKEEMVEEIENNFGNYCKKFNFALKDPRVIGNKKLIMGASVFGNMHKEPPTFYDGLNGGMEVLVTRPFGDLAPINVYLSSLASDEYRRLLDMEGIDLGEVEKAKRKIVEKMEEPNLKAGEIINRYLPEWGEGFREEEHIAVTGDLSGPGIFIFKEISETANVDIRLEEIPLAYPDLVQFASREFLMDNGTAGTNGAIAIIANGGVIEDVGKDLSKAGYDPKVIGRVMGKGEGKLYVGKEVENMISSKGILREFDVYEN